jgi:CBS domain-containing protein
MPTVADVMSTPVITVAPQTTFKDAVRILRRRRVSGLPVVDAAGRMVGIVSEGDLLNKLEGRVPDSNMFESRGRHLYSSRAEALDVTSAMSTQVVAVRPDVPVALAAREMHTRGFKRLPVVDEKGTLVGIVSRGDLLTVFLRTDARVRADVKRVLAAAPGGTKLKARVSDGVVELEGSFEERTHGEALVRTVTGIEGVIGVRSHLVFSAPLA